MKVDDTQTDIMANVWVSLISSRFEELLYDLEIKKTLNDALCTLMAQTVSCKKGSQVEPGWDLIRQALVGDPVPTEDLANRLKLISSVLVLGGIDDGVAKAFNFLLLELEVRHSELKNLVSRIRA